MPSLIERGKNLANDVSFWVKKGFPMVQLEKSEQRLGICKSCEFYQQSKCLKCGCFMPWKVKFATVRCPAGKWDREPVL